MNAQELELILLTELEYGRQPGLRYDADIPWPGGRAIPHINSALILENVPIAYFSRFSELDIAAIQQLHKNVWSQSKAPLLFVTLPHEIRVYNGYEPTPKPQEPFDTQDRLLKHLDALTDHLTAQREIRSRLVDNHYQRIYLETGAFWDTTEGQRVHYEGRADRHLVEGMKQMRKLLMDQGLANRVAYTLLGRSVFIRYLEDRKILTADWVSAMTDGQACSYLEALGDRSVAYLLFERIEQRFNGDLFPIEQEEQEVNNSHLELLYSFLSGTNLATGQLSLWPYNFEYIPIELISNIYDTFLEERRSSGAYYTPLLLADFILEETMGNDVVRPDMTVLDPACGSGIFLVGAYRRLIQAWRRQNGDPTAQDLKRILENSIFGMDKESEAVRIAAFSLYLEILNHLSNEQIGASSFQFPSLNRKNLICRDFFDEQVDTALGHQRFDRVVGNMPWGQGTLTTKAGKWLENHQYVVGGRQAAPAFMLRVPAFCKPEGEIALLAPAKSTIHVTSERHQIFRKQFFTTWDVRAVVNFAAMRHELFQGAVGPAVAVFYTPNAPNYDKKLIYGVPKPSSLSQHLKAIVLDTTEIKFLDRQELLEHPELWKVALWGTHRDAALIERLGAFATLRDQSKILKWKIREGFIDRYEKGKQNEASWLQGMPFVSTRKFTPYWVNPVDTVQDHLFHRCRTKDVYQAPLVLVHRSKCQAAFSDQDTAFRDTISSITGSPGQETILKWLVCLINSPLARYYQFLTSTRWAVERANPLHIEYADMPFLVPDQDDPDFRQLIRHFDFIVQLVNQKDVLWSSAHKDEIEKHKTAINTLVFKLFNLHPVEQQLVQDMLEYGIEFFNWSKRRTRRPRGAKPVQEPGTEMLQAYADVFVRTVTSLLKIKNQTLNATVYKNGAPLTVASFEFVRRQDARPVCVITESDAMHTRLQELNEQVLEQKTPSMYLRRHTRVYDGNLVSLVRPSEQRFWTQSQARADADAFLAELLS